MAHDDDEDDELAEALQALARRRGTDPETLIRSLAKRARDHDEDPRAARERWEQEERQMPTGVLGLGGMTGGGIFGDAPIVTEGYDPAAMARAESRFKTGSEAQLTMRVIRLLESRERADRERDEVMGQLSEVLARLLPEGRRRKR